MYCPITIFVSFSRLILKMYWLLRGVLLMRAVLCVLTWFRQNIKRNDMNMAFGFKPLLVAIYPHANSTRKDIEQTLGSVLALSYPLIRRIGLSEKSPLSASIVQQFKETTVQIQLLKSNITWGSSWEDSVHVLWIRAGTTVSPNAVALMWSQGTPEHNLALTAVPKPTASIFEILMFRRCQMDIGPWAPVGTDNDILLRVPGNTTVTKTANLGDAVTSHTTPSSPFDDVKGSYMSTYSLLNAAVGLFIYVVAVVDGFMTAITFILLLCLLMHIFIPTAHRLGVLYYVCAPVWTLLVESTVTYHACKHLFVNIKRTMSAA